VPTDEENRRRNREGMSAWLRGIIEIVSERSGDPRLIRARPL
jgi:hypothetical protein